MAGEVRTLKLNAGVHILLARNNFGDEWSSTITLDRDQAALVQLKPVIAAREASSLWQKCRDCPEHTSKPFKIDGRFSPTGVLPRAARLREEAEREAAKQREEAERLKKAEVEEEERMAKLKKEQEGRVERERLAAEQSAQAEQRSKLLGRIKKLQAEIEDLKFEGQQEERQAENDEAQAQLQEFSNQGSRFTVGSKELAELRRLQDVHRRLRELYPQIAGQFQASEASGQFGMVGHRIAKSVGAFADTGVDALALAGGNHAEGIARVYKIVKEGVSFFSEDLLADKAAAIASATGDALDAGSLKAGAEVLKSREEIAKALQRGFDEKTGLRT